MDRNPSDIAAWTAAAADWIAWARAPGHDAFWAYRDAFRGFVGADDGAAIDIGCGEGRIARELAGLGYRVTACDGVPAMVEAARRAGSAVECLLAPAAALPVADGAFDLAVMYNMLMDVDDIDAALAEAARVLRPGGRLVAGIVHPFADMLMAARVDGGELTFPESYFGTKPFDETTSRNGLSVRFRGWQRPLHAYADAIAGAGLTIAGIAEPQPAADHPWSETGRWQRLPLFLWFDARKP